MKDPFAPFATGEASPDPKAEQLHREFSTRIPQGLRVDVETCFPQAGAWGEKRANQARLELLEKNAPVLIRCLGDRDRIRFVIHGREQLWWEAFAAGQWAMLLNRTVLVITEEKLIAIHADSKGRPARFVNQIPFSAIKKIGGFFANLTVTTPGQKRVYNMKSAERKAVIAMVPPASSPTGGLEMLCPSCFAPSRNHVEQCASCLAKFKSPRVAGLRSLVVPGLGTWYVGNKGFAALQMIRGAILWLIFAAMLVEVSTTSKRDGSAVGVAIFLVVLLVFIHGMDSLISRAQAKKGLIALDEKLPSAADLSGR